jgi:hypothetical protein
MASASKVYKARKRLKARKTGRDRKNKLEKCGTTPSRAVFFGDVSSDPEEQLSGES